MMRKYAHVGYPKAASTWLQVYLFPRHPDLHHLGRHNGDEIVDDDLRIALWNDLIARPSLLYDPRETAATFERLFAAAAARKAVASGISQEVLTLSLVGSVDLTERARRLRGAMGEDTTIVLVVRNQLDWIRSTFCGLLKEGGMPLGWSEFLAYFYVEQDQSPFSSLFYDDVWALYAELFGERNVHLVPFELLKRDAGQFAAKVCDAIGVRPITDLPSTRINEAPSAKALTTALGINQKAAFYFGSTQFRRPLAFAAAPMYRNRLGVEQPTWAAAETAQ